MKTSLRAPALFLSLTLLAVTTTVMAAVGFWGEVTQFSLLATGAGGATAVVTLLRLGIPPRANQ